MPVEPWFSYPPEMNASRILGTAAPLMVAAANWAVMAATAAAMQATFLAQTAMQSTNLIGSIILAVIGACLAEWIYSRYLAKH